MIRLPEWPTVGLFILTYALWFAAILWLAEYAILPTALLLGVIIAQHSSLQHEALHGHPFQHQAWNSTLAGLPLILIIPYLRFRDTHLTHHLDCELTDPYDDPESNFLDGGVWDRLPRLARWILATNNTLAGRLVIGPAWGTWVFLVSEWRQRSDPSVIRGWGWHAISVIPLLAFVLWSPMPLWAYLLSCYLALSLLRIRTFLEHRAHEQRPGRTVVIEDKGPLALLFLNNNLHMVHHTHPATPWYRLPAKYREGRDEFLAANGGYIYRSYGEVFRRYFLKAKDPVAHPLWRRS